jgi:hypothetical protein
MNRQEESAPPSNPEPASQDATDPERDPDELEPTITTPAGRFWDIELPPNLQARSRVDRLLR